MTFSPSLLIWPLFSHRNGMVINLAETQTEARHADLLEETEMIFDGD